MNTIISDPWYKGDYLPTLSGLKCKDVTQILQAEIIQYPKKMFTIWTATGLATFILAGINAITLAWASSTRPFSESRLDLIPSAGLPGVGAACITYMTPYVINRISKGVWNVGTQLNNQSANFSNQYEIEGLIEEKDIPPLLKIVSPESWKNLIKEMNMTQLCYTLRRVGLKAFKAMSKGSTSLSLNTVNHFIALSEMSNPEQAVEILSSENTRILCKSSIHLPFLLKQLFAQSKSQKIKDLVEEYTAFEIKLMPRGKGETSSQIVYIKINGETLVQANRELLIANSGYFKTFFEGGMKGKASQSVLQEDEIGEDDSSVPLLNVRIDAEDENVYELSDVDPQQTCLFLKLLQGEAFESIDKQTIIDLLPLVDQFIAERLYILFDCHITANLDWFSQEELLELSREYPTLQYMRETLERQLICEGTTTCVSLAEKFAIANECRFINLETHCKELVRYHILDRLKTSRNFKDKSVKEWLEAAKEILSPDRFQTLLGEVTQKLSPKNFWAVYEFAQENEEGFTLAQCTNYILSNLDELKPQLSKLIGKLPSEVLEKLTPKTTFKALW